MFKSNFLSTEQVNTRWSLLRVVTQNRTWCKCITWPPVHSMKSSFNEINSTQIPSLQMHSLSQWAKFFRCHSERTATVVDSTSDRIHNGVKSQIYIRWNALSTADDKEWQWSHQNRLNGVQVDLTLVSQLGHRWWAHVCCKADPCCLGVLWIGLDGLNLEFNSSLTLLREARRQYGPHTNIIICYDLVLCWTVLTHCQR